MSPPARRSSPPSLRHRLTLWLGLLILGALTTLTGVLVWMLHYQVHHQTDLLLLRFAEEHAHTYTHQTAERRPPLHDHDPSMAVVVLTEDCHPLTLSGTLEDPPALDTLCAWTRTDSPAFVNLRGLATRELRVVHTVAQDSEGKRLHIFVGMDHAAIDTSTWAAVGAASAIGALVLLILITATWLLVRRFTTDLEELSHACARLDEQQLGSLRHPTATLPSLSHAASRETQQLSATLHQLVERIARAFQNRERMIAEVAHELRTPLTALMGEAEVTLRRERSANEYREALQRTLLDAQHLHGLTEALLTLARIRDEDPRCSRIDLNHCIAEQINRITSQALHLGVRLRRHDEACETDAPEAHRDTITRTLTLHWIPTEPTPYVLADPLSLARILENLLTNVIRHADASELRIDVRPGADRHQLLLSDNGTGLPDAVRDALFEPFVRQYDHEGHGLGLHLAHQLAERMHAELTLHRSDASGTTWSILLPRG